MHKRGIAVIAAGLLTLTTIFCSVSYAVNQRLALIKAAMLGDLEEVQSLLGKGADVNAKNKYGGTALITAAGRAHPKILELLMDKGADVNVKMDNGMTPEDRTK